MLVYAAISKDWRCGRSQSAVSRIWRAFAWQPHRSETCQLSRDPLFIEKVRDLVGLYLNPPERALVLGVDEKEQIQALDRTQPLLPMRPGQIERRSHDYKRHGIPSLFAALEMASGRVMGECHRRHGAMEFRRFLDRLDASTRSLSPTTVAPRLRSSFSKEADIAPKTLFPLN